MNRHPQNKEPIDLWAITKMVSTAAIMIPTTWLRFRPMVNDLYSLLSSASVADFPGLAAAYFQHLQRVTGRTFYLGFLQILAMFLFANIAAHALQIQLSKLILSLGFRAEEAEESRLLHPEKEV